MNTSINLQGMNQTELQALQTQIVYDFFAPQTSDAQRDEMISFSKAVNTCLPHSFVLASLFDVEAMTLEIPDFAYELDPCIGVTPCPDCEGQGWLEVEGSAWYSEVWASRGHRFSSLKACHRCHCTGEVLEPHQALEHELTYTSLEPLLYLALAA
jgi:hypothetical protein